MVTITWASVWGGISGAAKYIKDTTVKYVGVKTVTLAVGIPIAAGGYYAHKHGATIFVKGMKFEERSVPPDNAADLVVYMRAPFSDTVYLQKTTATGQPTGEFIPAIDKVEQDLERMLNGPTTPEASGNKK